jgi:two-component system chemotaxis sensor kinase CheA
METDRLFEIFISESEEIIQDLESDLIQLENTPEDKELIDKIFRGVHTMKSSSGIVGLDRLSRFIHIMENCFERVRQGELAVTKKLISVFLETNDFLKNTITKISSGDESIDEKTIEEFEKKFSRFSGTIETKKRKTKKIDTPQEEKEHYYKISMKFRPNLFETGQDPILLFRELEDLGQVMEVDANVLDIPDFSNFKVHTLYTSWELVLKTKKSFSTIQNVFVFVEEENEISIQDVSHRFKEDVDKKKAGKLIGEILVDKGTITEFDVEEALNEHKKTGEILLEKKKITEEQLEEALITQRASRDVRIANTIRVDTDRLDKLVDLVGEMVIGVAHINQFIETEAKQSRNLSGAVEGLDRISRDLQEQVMRVRMVPIEGTFNRFDRVVRDLAQKQDKKIKLYKSGVETELDKNVMEKIVDPLKHMIRNSVDHGIETSKQRKDAHKSETGTIHLKAYQQEGNIFIEITDDGCGIDKNAVLAKAIDLGLTQKNQEHTDKEIYDFMFMPGFSTAKKVTDVSGRGVGLDVVRRNLESLRANIEVISEPGKGTTFQVCLPLTLAIIDGMNVRVGPETLTIPLLSIIEAIRPKEDDVKTVEGKGEVISVRGEYLSLVRLHQLLNIPTELTDPSQALVVIVESEKRRLGFLVDDVVGEQQAVIKSLDKNFKRVQGITGATILGDGTISLILDIHGIERMAFV